MRVLVWDKFTFQTNIENCGKCETKSRHKGKFHFNDSLEPGALNVFLLTASSAVMTSDDAVMTSSDAVEFSLSSEGDTTSELRQRQTPSQEGAS